jgi:hypothetical protein
MPVKGYGGHSIEPHGSLAEASDSNVVLIPPIFNDIEQTLADDERGGLCVACERD